MIKRLSAILCILTLFAVASLGLPSLASAHNTCGLAMAVEVPCDHSVPPKPGVPANQRKWYTGTEHTPGYHDRIWYDYSPSCTQGPCILPGPFGSCGAYASVPSARAFPGTNDINGPTTGKKRLYCGMGTTSPVPHLHYVEPPGS